MNISILEYFDNVYISYGVKIALSTHAIRALQTSMMVLLTKIVSNVTLKTLAILTKRLILDAWLGSGRSTSTSFQRVSTKKYIILSLTAL